jgi:holo-[acyl-carrier protein] synthase
MIGIDLVEIKRIVLSSHFINHVLSLEEKEILKHKKDKKEFLAGRFAAKEAFLKANHKKIFEIPFNEIKVLSNDDGSPYIIFEEVRYDNVSISHENKYAIAVVEISI